jgi:DNA-binding NarL/FixJ family response regulator
VLTRVIIYKKYVPKIKRARKINSSSGLRPPKRPVAEVKTSLSKREQEILELLGRGLSNKEIGARLELSPFTVRNHLSRVFEKLKVRSRTEAAVAYLRTPNLPG